MPTYDEYFGQKIFDIGSEMYEEIGSAGVYYSRNHTRVCYFTLFEKSPQTDRHVTDNKVACSKLVAYRLFLLRNPLGRSWRSVMSIAAQMPLSITMELLCSVLQAGRGSHMTDAAALVMAD